VTADPTSARALLTGHAGDGSRFDMTADRRSDRRSDPPFDDGENPYIPPYYYLVLIAALALLIAATLL
jgi:hypothetical protein